MKQEGVLLESKVAPHEELVHGYVEPAYTADGIFQTDEVLV